LYPILARTDAAPYENRPWAPAARQPFLFVLIPESTINKYSKGDTQKCQTAAEELPEGVLCVLAAVTKVGTSSETFRNLSPYVFSMEEFQKEPGRVHPKRQNEKLLFAVHNMSDNILVDAAQLQALMELEKLFSELQTKEK
jgi:hypothetical protein